MTGARRVLQGGTLWDAESGTEHHALAVDAGAIVALDEAAVEWGRAHGADRVDTTGRFVLPAFGDGHAHPLFGGLESQGPAVRGHDSVPSVVEAVRRYAVEHPELDWIVGGSYESSLAPEGLFDARWLDEAVTDRPVLLRAWDYHTAWVNTRALELAGITADTPEPVLGELPRRSDGSPLGTLRERGALDLVATVMPAPPLEDRVAAIERAGRRAWADRFTAAASLLREHLGRLAIDVEHVGSTSVPGLVAKPIVDIDLLVEETENESVYVPVLEGLGYRLVLREPWWHGHRMLVSYDEQVNLQVWPQDAPEPVRHRLFRDWLRTHADDRHLYEMTKLRLAQETAAAPGEYSLAKSAVIDEIYGRIFADVEPDEDAHSSDG